MQLWEYLLELLASRRRRLELNVRLQQMFQSMIALLDWMSDMKVQFQTMFALVVFFNSRKSMWAEMLFRIAQL